ncbi:MAG: MerR family transcriptional regulator [Rhizobacter sp.]
MNAKLSIGLVARRTGVTVPTVRYYEEIGLLPPTSRTESGQRHNGEATVRRLAFIRRCRDFGFPLEQVRELVALVDDAERPCAEARALAASRLEDVRRKLDELKALETSLAAFVCGCDAACVGGPAVDCTILGDLSMSARTASPDASGCCP